MNHNREFIKKHRKKLIIGLTLFYLLTFILLFLYKKLPEDVSGWINYLLPCLVLLSVILDDPKPDEEVREMYFPVLKRKELIAQIQKMEFTLSKENHSQIKFSKKGKGLIPKRLKISKIHEDYWKVRGKNKYLKELNTFMLHYTFLH